MEHEAGRRCEPPFWGVVWPAARALSHCLRSGAIDVRGASVLEIGCGGAAAAIAAKLAGARSVRANDLDPAARSVARANALANGVVLDLDDRDLTHLDRLPASDLILIADFFYEATTAHRLHVLLQAARARGTSIVLADGGRTFFPRERLALVAQATLAVDPAIEGTHERTVRVWAW
ncbi:MAG: 50S ribosomal protein L11 methyltransferase [Planctomycetota bacterium]